MSWSPRQWGLLVSRPGRLNEYPTKEPICCIHYWGADVKRTFRLEFGVVYICFLVASFRLLVECSAYHTPVFCNLFLCPFPPFPYCLDTLSFYFSGNPKCGIGTICCMGTEAEIRAYVAVPLSEFPGSSLLFPYLGTTRERIPCSCAGHQRH
jgi:hypothetical protein